jgi:hypothetical protein
MGLLCSLKCARSHVCLLHTYTCGTGAGSAGNDSFFQNEERHALWNYSQ